MLSKHSASMAPLLNQCQWWLTSKQIAKTHLGHANRLLSSQDPSDSHTALALLDSALKLWPQFEKALELKARTLLTLRRFKEVVHMLQDYLPSFSLTPCSSSAPESPLNKEKAKLLENCHVHKNHFPYIKHFTLSELKKKLNLKLPKKLERQQWRYVVLGQACCHLGMMDDALVLLQRGKEAASVASRKQSNGMKEDSFCSESVSMPEAGGVTHMLSNIKALLRRKAAALASLEAGLFADSIRHFSKIVDGKRGGPQGFLAECYIQRAMAYQGAGRLADAIADCNRTLALNPTCMEALHARASLYEMIRCYTDCLHDLEQLKLLYETQFRCHKMAEPNIWMSLPHTTTTDLQENLECMKRRIMAIRKRLGSQNIVDYYKLLGLQRGCSRADAERAHLLLSLKHRPEKATHFVDRCELVDNRDTETIREAAGSSALRLFQLIQEAYTGELTNIVEEEIKRQQKQAWCMGFQNVSIVDKCIDNGRREIMGENANGKHNGQNIELLALPSTPTISCSKEKLQLINAVATCRELANEAWMGVSEWSLTANHHHLQPLTVT